MSDTMEIIISAVDSASEVFQSIIGSVTSMGDSISDVIGMASSDFDSMVENVSGFQDAVSDIDSSSIEDLAEELGMSTDEVERLIDVGAGLGSIPFNDAAASADELEQEITEADDALGGLNDDLGLINSSMLMSLGSEVGKLGDSAEGMAQEMNTAAISVGQLATNAGVAEPQMISLINNISNATFPQAEAMAYSQALTQMGVSFDSLGSSATNMDRINDATGIGYDKVIKLTQGLQSMGITADNLPSSFNAIAFAQANVTGGADTLQRTLMRQASTINEYGLNVDQVVLIMQKLSETGVSTTKMGTELSNVLKENNGDISAIEQSLGMANGTLSDASAVTGQYEGQLQSLADEEMQHKTILDQIGAAWEDVSLSIGQFMTPFLSVVGLIGQIGSFGLQVKGLRELISLTKSLTEVEIIDSAVKSGKAAIMSVVTAATTLYGIAVGVLTGEIGLATAATLAFNAVIAMNPVALAVIALAALVAIVYEVGKAFGWWSDIGSMIDAIWAGIQELWDAFINHPDVQAAIQVISDAWNSLSSAVSGAWNAVLDFFNINENGSFDIVQALIDGVGQAWNNLKNIIMPLINIFSTVLSVLWDLANGNISVVTAITAIWNSFAINIPVILNTIRNIFRTIWNSIKTVVSTLVRGMVNSVVSLLKGLASRAYSALMSVVNSIVSAGKSWVSNAISYGSQVVSGVINQITGLPGKIATEFGKIPGRINEAVSNAVSAAANFGDNIKNAVLNALHIASPGIIQRKIATEFKDTVTRIEDNIDSAYNAGRSFGKSIVDGVGSIDLNDGLSSELSTVDIGTGQAFDIRTGEYYEVEDNLEVTVKQEHEFVFSFKDVPEWIDTDKLLALIKKCMSDKTVIKELVSNPDFQALDNQVKTRILRKVNRSRGV